jgi:hypothetical protein
MPAIAQIHNDFLEFTVEYLDLLHRQGIITNLGDIDTEAVIKTTEELRDYFMTLQANDAD